MYYTIEEISHRLPIYLTCNYIYMCYFICCSHLIKIGHRRILYYANNILFKLEYF